MFLSTFLKYKHQIHIKITPFLSVRNQKQISNNGCVCVCVEWGVGAEYNLYITVTIFPFSFQCFARNVLCNFFKKILELQTVVIRLKWIEMLARLSATMVAYTDKNNNTIFNFQRTNGFGGRRKPSDG